MNTDTEGQAYNGIPTGSRSAADTAKAQQCAQQCFSDYSGIGAGAVAAQAATGPYYPKSGGLAGGGPTGPSTSLTSELGGKIRISVRIPGTGTGNLIRGLGRIANPVSVGICLYDVLAISACTKLCMEN